MPDCGLLYNKGTNQQHKAQHNMPKVHFQNRHATPPIEVKNRTFQTPKRLDSAEQWVSAARKVVPEIPKVHGSDWYVLTFDPDLTIILIELSNLRDERVRIAIAR